MDLLQSGSIFMVLLFVGYLVSEDWKLKRAAEIANNKRKYEEKRIEKIHNTPLDK